MILLSLCVLVVHLAPQWALGLGKGARLAPAQGLEVTPGGPEVGFEGGCACAVVNCLGIVVTEADWHSSATPLRPCQRPLPLQPRVVTTLNAFLRVPHELILSSPFIRRCSCAPDVGNPGQGSECRQFSAHPASFVECRVLPVTHRLGRCIVQSEGGLSRSRAAWQLPTEAEHESRE